ncbi:hypothetical protein [Microbulbifer sp. VVAC002]|uniref:hypothetical protein n=1 Tax=Microbulbifer sp. VVAC002 TaxID=3243387 RepID=UPI00403A72C8
MKYRAWLLAATLLLASSQSSADSQLIGKVVTNEDICSLFYRDERFVWFPKGVFKRSHFKSKRSTFDANNDGIDDYLKLKENFTSYQQNMMYYAYKDQNSRESSNQSYIFPQSWMQCPDEKSSCSLNDKISDGVLDIGVIPGREKPVRYRSRYTNVFPFMRGGFTYYKITTESVNKDVVSIIKPLPENEKYEIVCVFITGSKLQ